MDRLAVMNARRARIGALGLLVASILGASAPAMAGSAPDSPRLQVAEWNGDLLPAIFLEDDSPLAFRAYPPDTLRIETRPELQVAYAEVMPAIDGRIDDWPVVRWRDLRGARALVRGRWSGPTDAVARFALLWLREGLVLAAHVQDDSLRSSNGSLDERVDSILLYLGSASPVVQRYWRGAERSFRVWSDGRTQAWTRLRNRIPVLFDASSIGVRAATRASQSSGAGSVTYELFVPWDVLFPLLPHARAGPLVNVLYEDVDGSVEKLFAWATRPEDGTLVQTWARLHCRPGPPDGTPLVSLASRHVEPGRPVEWSVVRWGEGTGSSFEITARGAAPWAALEGELPAAAPAIVRVWDVPPARSPWPHARRLEIEIGTSGGSPWRRDQLYLAPSLEAIAAGAQQQPVNSDSRRFPSGEDVSVRLSKVASVVRELRPWYRVRYQHLGILTSRAAAWASIESQLVDIELLHDLVRAPDAPEVQQRAATRWPQRAPEGYPLGQAFVRGFRSLLDDSVQPYALYVSRAAAAGEVVPLVVVLHAYNESEIAPFQRTSLAAAVEARGWLALSPYGRGDTGFQLAGERDVLEALQHVRAQFSVDDRRIYLIGYSMGGTGTWTLSLRQPDLFAASVIVSGYADMDQPGLYEALAYHPSELFFFERNNPARLVRPGLVTSYRILHAGHDPYVSVVHARIMGDRLTEHGIDHELVLPESELHGSALLELDLERTFVWLAGKRRESPARIDDAWFQGTGGEVATVFARGPFAIVHGSRSLPQGTAPIVPPNRDGKALTGPAADARVADQFAQEWNALFFGWPRVLADSSVTEALRDSTNLVVVGDPRTNALLNAVASELPVRYAGDTFEIDGRTWNFADAGVLFATANPTAPERTLVVLSGMAERLSGFTKSLLKLGADYVVTNDHHEILAIGDFRGFGSVRPRSQEARPGGSR